MVVTINKWGHSIGIRIPKKMANSYNIKEGSDIQLIETEEGILIRAVKSEITYEDLLDSIPENYDNEDLIPNDLESELW